MCWPHQSTNTFCPVGTVVQQVLCAVVQLFPNLVEIIIIVLDSSDTNLESFEQVVCPQASTNTLLQKARSGLCSCPRACMSCHLSATASLGVTQHSGRDPWSIAGSRHVCA